MRWTSSRRAVLPAVLLAFGAAGVAVDRAEAQRQRAPARAVAAQGYPTDTRYPGYPGDPAYPRPTTDLAGAVLATHNSARAAVRVPPLQWDAKLAQGAATWANHLARLGRMEHSPDKQRPDQGENLWMGTAGAYRPEDMVGSWVAERRYFRNQPSPNFSTTGNWADVGHYSQIVWRDTKRVGCAIGRGRGDEVLVCRYQPAGNWDGERAY